MNERSDYRKIYTIGIDYGTELGRAVLVDLDNGQEAAVHVTRYCHGVIEGVLPGSGRTLRPEIVSAMLAAVAAGARNGGYNKIEDAARRKCFAV